MAEPTGTLVRHYVRQVTWATCSSFSNDMMRFRARYPGKHCCKSLD